MAHSSKSVDDIKKLSPQERIRQLKELEEERKKEIEEAEALIKETVQEMDNEEEKRRMPIPEARATDLSILDTIEEKQIVSTHHFLPTKTADAATPQPQKKNLEQVTEEENVRAQQAVQPQQFSKPEYAIGMERRQSAMASYISGSQQTVTSGMRTEGSQMEDKVAGFYKDKTTTGGEAGNEKYFGTHQQVTGSYEMHKAEQEKQRDYDTQQKRRHGPA